MKKEGKEYKRLCAVSAGHTVKCTSNPVIMTIAIFFGDKRKRDVHGHMKALIDGFNGILYDDDSQIKGLIVTKHYDPKMPRAVVTVEETTEDKFDD
jgi:Holliday junction resolvase RusA-like endonuclease